MTTNKPTTVISSGSTLKPVKLHILLDRSGSMRGFEADVIGGFNTFKEKQCQVEGECSSLSCNLMERIHLRSFSDLEIGSVPDLTNDKYWPRDNTPLWDAVGRLITTVDKENADTDVDNIIWIFTDGYENASREFTSGNVRELIKEKEAAGWSFIFMGCDIDAYEQGGELEYAKLTL